MSVTALSLRARKKAQTSQALVDAAYALVTDHGIRALTAEAVAERAGVSRRTFFNYFPTVDAVLADGISNFFTDLSERLAARPLDEPVMDALDAMVAVTPDRELLERVAVLRAVGATSPAARAAFQAALYDWLTWFVAHLRSRLPVGTDELYAVNLATAVVAAAEASIITWVERTGGDLSPDGLALQQHLLARSIGYLRTGFSTPHPA